MDKNVSDYRSLLLDFFDVVKAETGVCLDDGKLSESLDMKRIIDDWNSSKIVNFLKKRSIDEIQVIQAVMYIGSDKKTVNDENTALNDMLDEISHDVNWDNKDVLINEICEKAALKNWLKKGIEILHINTAI